MLSWQNRPTVMLSFRVQHWRRSSTSGGLRIWDALVFAPGLTEGLPSCRSSGEPLGYQYMAMQVAQGPEVKRSNPRWKWEFLKNSEKAYLRYDKRNFVQCKTGESTPSMVWPTLASRTAKNQNRLHAKHESGLIMQSMKAALLLSMFCGLSVCWSRLWACKSGWTDRNANWGLVAWNQRNI